MVEKKNNCINKKRNIEIHNCYLAQTKYMRLESKITLFQNTRKLTYELKKIREKK
jgi:hypothetical protein